MRYGYYLFLLFSLFFSFLSVQGKQKLSFRDSLEHALLQKNTNKGEIFYELANYYSQHDDSLTLLFASQSISFTSKKNNPELFAKASLQKGIILNKKNNFFEAIQCINNTLDLSVSDSLYAQLLYCQSKSYFRTHQFGASIRNLLLALPILERIENIQLLFEARKLISLNYISLKDYSGALVSLTELHNIAKVTGNMVHLGICYTYFGIVAENMNDYLESLRYFQLAIDYLSEYPYSDEYVECMNHIGSIYFKQRDLNTAYDYFKEAEGHHTGITDSQLKAQTYFNIAKVKFTLNDKPTAEKNTEKALEICRAHQLKETEADIYIYIGEQNIAKKDFSAALHYLNRSVQLASFNQKSEQNANSLYLYSLTYYNLGNYDNAILYIEKSIKYAVTSKNYELLYKGYHLLSLISRKLGNLEEAFSQLELSQQWKDSANSVISSHDLRYLQAKFESKKKQEVINTLTHERMIQEKVIELGMQNLEKHRNYMWSFLYIISFVLSISFVLGIWLNQKRKANKLLEQRNLAIIQQKEEIESQRTHLQEINSQLDKLSIVARETDNAVKLMNARGEITWINEGYTRLYGFSLDDLKGNSLQNFIGSQSSVDVNQLVNVWFGNKNPITFESLNTTKSGKQIWAQTTLTPILDGNGKIDKMIAIDSDITALKLAEEKILSINNEITSSISYAKRIQEAMITPFSFLTGFFPNSFVFYKPKAIVSGDFYWFANRHDRIIIACADCTGHGVPGAFMSLIGISFLNKIVNEKGFVTPSIILNRMRINVINHLNQSAQKKSAAGDGMDMSLISIDKKNNQLEYAGAMNPVYILREDNLIELKPDRMPVGFFDNEDRPFSTTSISLRKGDQIFMFSDGYYDQFGGEKGSKMKAHRFKEIIKEAQWLPTNEKQELIEKRFNEWKGDNHQIDDILVMGITYE